MPRKPADSRLAKEPRQAHIQFRPGRPLKTRLRDIALLWNLSESEAAKALTSLAAFEFRPSHYPLMVELAIEMGEQRDLGAVCYFVWTEIDAAIRARQRRSAVALDDGDKLQCIKKLLKQHKAANPKARLRSFAVATHDDRGKMAKSGDQHPHPD